MSSPYPAQGDGDKDGPTPGLGKSSPRPPPVAYEKGDTVVDVESLLRSCSAKGLSAKLTDRIREADVDRDGVLSVDELVEVMRREMQAVSDRKLFRNILIALFVAVLVLIATLCGTVYAIVDLSKEVKNDNGVLVSSSSGDVMSTGSAQQTVPVGPELLALLDFPESLSNVHSLVIPAIGGDDTTVYKIAKLTSSPGTGSMNIATVDGTLLLMNQSGVYERSESDGYAPIFEMFDSRRKLLIENVGGPGSQGAPNLVVSLGSGPITPRYSPYPYGRECDRCYGPISPRHRECHRCYQLCFDRLDNNDGRPFVINDCLHQCHGQFACSDALTGFNATHHSKAAYLY